MQLKRILARDSRTATDKAIALYGADVLIISNHQVNGQTELVVALDFPAAPAELSGQPPLGMVAAHAAASAANAALPRADLARPGKANFLEALRQAEKSGARTEPEYLEPLALDASDTSGAAEAADTQRSLPANMTPNTQAQDARDYIRSREIVDLVRDELAGLRREFRLTQQTAGWQQGLQLSDSVRGLARAIGDAPMPQALRALLLDSLQDHPSAETALQALRALLEHTLSRPEAALPTQGVHAIAGPSGAGKTLMTARLARHAEQTHGAAQVALISYQDVRAGAWSQMQMLAAQAGVDCFRAADAATLALLLNELTSRRLVLIDTPGVQMAERLAEVRELHAAAKCHAVVPADASSATLERLCHGAAPAWESLLVSKLDECTQPWPLLHFLSNNSLAPSGGSNGFGVYELLSTSPVQRLVALAVEQLASAGADQGLTSTLQGTGIQAAGTALPPAGLSRSFSDLRASA